MKTVAFCEIDPFCRRVLHKHWPDVPCHEDITKLRGEDVGPVDVVCGGFPCQDISVAGKGAGLAGERSGLFYELARLIGEIRPRYAILENVSALLSRGLGDVLGELATLGYDAQWHCIPASAVGAPHRRDRVWIVGRDTSGDPSNSQRSISQGASPITRRIGSELSDAIGRELRQQSRRRNGANGASAAQPGQHGQNGHVADAEGDRWPSEGKWPASGYANGRDQLPGRQAHWDVEPDVGRVADGVSSRTHRLIALGNAVVPQIPELIGRAIMDVEMAKSE